MYGIDATRNLCQFLSRQCARANDHSNYDRIVYSSLHQTSDHHTPYIYAARLGVCEILICKGNMAINLLSLGVRPTRQMLAIAETLFEKPGLAGSFSRATSIVERIYLGCASNLMGVLICLTAPSRSFFLTSAFYAP